MCIRDRARRGRGGGLGRVVRYDKGDRVGAADLGGWNDGFGPGEGLSLSGGVGPDGGGRPGHDDEDTNTGCRWRLIGDRRRRRSGHSRYSRHGPPGRRRPCWARRNRCGPGTRCIQEDRRCGRVGHGSSLERESEDGGRTRSGRCREDRGVPAHAGCGRPASCVSRVGHDTAALHPAVSSPVENKCATTPVEP